MRGVETRHDESNFNIKDEIKNGDEKKFHAKASVRNRHGIKSALIRRKRINGRIGTNVQEPKTK